MSKVLQEKEAEKVINVMQIKVDGEKALMAFLGMVEILIQT